MKKALSIFAALLFAFVGIAKAQVIQIGSCESSTYQIPFNSIYNYSFTETLYQVTDINTAGPIYYIAYHMDDYSSPTTKDVMVFMKHVTRTDFYDVSDYEPVSSSNIVFDGTWDMTPGWTIIPLDTPFDYNGVDNLLVAFYVNDTEYEGRYFCYTDYTSNRTLSYYSDDYVPNPFDLASYAGYKSVYSYSADIRLGFTNCSTPTYVNVEATPSNTHVSWDGMSSTYTLQYRPKTAAIWTSLNNITGHSYDLSDLEDDTYVIRVQANCDPDHWVSTEFIIYTPQSTAKWYAFAHASYGGASWENKYVKFTMQDLTSVTASSMDYLSYDIQTGSFANGYVWIIDQYTGDLLKAPVSNSYSLVGDFETVMEVFTSNYVIAMSFNPANGRMYYIEQNGGMSFALKSFAINDPSTVSTHGVIGVSVSAFAINKTGEAYLLGEDSGFFYSLNLSNASLTKIGETNMHPYSNFNSMAFDMNTGELYWSSYSYSGVGMYYIDHTNGNTIFIGQVDEYGCELTSMFMVYDYNAVAENDVNVVNVYPNPVNDMLYIDGVEGQQVRVYDNMGRLVMDELYKGHLDVSGLAQGIYAVTVGNSTVKFVKK